MVPQPTRKKWVRPASCITSRRKRRTERSFPREQSFRWRDIVASDSCGSRKKPFVSAARIAPGDRQRVTERIGSVVPVTQRQPQFLNGERQRNPEMVCYTRLEQNTAFLMNGLHQQERFFLSYPERVNCTIALLAPARINRAGKISSRKARPNPSAPVKKIQPQLPSPADVGILRKPGQQVQERRRCHPTCPGHFPYAHGIGGEGPKGSQRA